MCDMLVETCFEHFQSDASHMIVQVYRIGWHMPVQMMFVSDVPYVACAKLNDNFQSLRTFYKHSDPLYNWNEMT